MVPLSGNRRVLGSSPYALSLLSGLVGSWSLADAGVADLSGLGNTLTANNTPTAAAGPGGNLSRATQFTAASSQTFSILDNAYVSVGAGRGFSIEAWVYMDTAPASVMRIAGQWNTTGERAYVLDWLNTTNHFRLQISNDGSAAGGVTGSMTPTTATWYHVVATYDYNDFKARLYVNGALDATGGAFAAHDVRDSTGSYIIGADSGSGFFNGRIAMDRLWMAHVLTLNDVIYLYNTGNGRVTVQGQGIV